MYGKIPNDTTTAVHLMLYFSLLARVPSLGPLIGVFSIFPFSVILENIRFHFLLYLFLKRLLPQKLLMLSHTGNTLLC